VDYKRHYNNLIDKASNRILDGYKERHHIIPKCLGGSDDIINIVELTAREHFVAHLLLVKMYPSNMGLVKAVQMMCCYSENQNRVSNRMYGWVKARFAKAQSVSQSGAGNSQYGTFWISNLNDKVSKKVPKGSSIPVGWVKGRHVWNKLEKERQKKYNSFIKQQKLFNNKKEELREMFNDYKIHGFAYVKTKYDIQIKISAFVLKMKRYFPDEYRRR